MIRANDRSYRVPERPVVVITVDGGDPAYFDDGLRRGLLPRLAEVLAAGGEYRLGSAEMPTLTNPNNLSIVTGVSPAIHGIPGNYCRLADGTLQSLVDPRLLRTPSIHAEFEAASVATLMVTTKDKLRLLLGHGGVPSVSVERAAGAGLQAYGIDDLEGLLGESAPDVYDPRASHYAMRLGLAVLREVGQLKLIYVSLTDRVQHAVEPGHPLADAFFAEFDGLLGGYLDAGCTVGITADHGMSAKHDARGRPRVHYLADTLDAAGVSFDSVVLPITDPYPRHHGALGSFAWLYLPRAHRARARQTLTALPGVAEVLDREQAAVIYEHPVDRIGDLAIAAAADTALGSRRSEHDLGQLQGPLRSHGGRHEQVVPLIVSRPVSGPLAARFRADTLGNRDLHELVLNTV